MVFGRGSFREIFSIPKAPPAGLKNIYGAIYANRAQIGILKAEKIL